MDQTEYARIRNFITISVNGDTYRSVKKLYKECMEEIKTQLQEAFNNDVITPELLDYFNVRNLRQLRLIFDNSITVENIDLLNERTCEYNQLLTETHFIDGNERLSKLKRLIDLNDFFDKFELVIKARVFYSDYMDIGCVRCGAQTWNCKCVQICKRCKMMVHVCRVEIVNRDCSKNCCGWENWDCGCGWYTRKVYECGCDSCLNNVMDSTSYQIL